MKKRILAFLLSALMLSSLVACGDSNQSSKEEESKAASESASESTVSEEKSEEKQNSKVIAYVTGDRRNMETQIATDVANSVVSYGLTNSSLSTPQALANSN